MKNDMENTVRRQYFRCISKMADFHFIQFEKGQSIPDRLEVRKQRSGLAQAGRSCHDERVHVDTSLG